MSAFRIGPAGAGLLPRRGAGRASARRQARAGRPGDAGAHHLARVLGMTLESSQRQATVRVLDFHLEPIELPVSWVRAIPE